MPLSVYANKLEEKVKERYAEKISAIGIDPIVYLQQNRAIYCSTLFLHEIAIQSISKFAARIQSDCIRIYLKCTRPHQKW